MCASILWIKFLSSSSKNPFTLPSAELTSFTQEPRLERRVVGEWVQWHSDGIEVNIIGNVTVEVDSLVCASRH